MEKQFKGHTYGVVGQLYTINEEENKKIPNKLIEVNNQFPEVFEEPKGLPLPRSHDHYILLKKGAQPFEFKLYRCLSLKSSYIGAFHSKGGDREVS